MNVACVPTRWYVSGPPERGHRLPPGGGAQRIPVIPAVFICRLHRAEASPSLLPSANKIRCSVTSVPHGYLHEPPSRPSPLFLCFPKPAVVSLHCVCSAGSLLFRSGFVDIAPRLPSHRDATTATTSTTSTTSCSHRCDYDQFKD